MRVRVFFLAMFFLGCATSGEKIARQGLVDFPGCRLAEEGEWRDEILVRVTCPNAASFLVTYGVYPVYTVRKR